MRTIRITQTIDTGDGGGIELAVETIVDEEDAREEGARVARIMDLFRDGILDETDEA